jgi:hypothetical protein
MLNFFFLFFFQFSAAPHFVDDTRSGETKSVTDDNCREWRRASLFFFSPTLFAVDGAVLLLLFSDRRESRRRQCIHFFVEVLDTCNPKLFGGGDEMIPHGLNPISRRGLCCASFFSLINNFASFPKRTAVFLYLSLDPAFFDTSCLGWCVFGCYS